MTNNLRLKETEKAKQFISSDPEKTISILDKYNQIPVIDDTDILQLKLLSDAYERIGDNKLSTLYNNLAKYFALDGIELSDYYFTLIKQGHDAVVSLLSGDSFEEDSLQKVIVYFFEIGKQLESSLLYYLYKKLYGDNSRLEKLIKFKNRDLINLLDFALCQEIDCIVMCDCAFEYEAYEALLIKKILSYLNHKAFVISNDRFSALNPDGTCVDSMEVGEVRQILLKCYKDNNSQNPFLIFGTSSLMKKIVREKGMYKYFETVFRQCFELPISYFDCVLFGDFNQTTHFLYGLNVVDCLDKNQTYDYSIVIPARNSSRFLEYTMLTCLNIDYDKNKYEVLISDNSDRGNNEIENLVKKYKKTYKNISYIRTPFALSLPRTFEFAYLSARGRRIISLGSDDGILKHSLNELNRIFQENHNPLLVHFQSISYTWPVKKNGCASIVYKKSVFENNIKEKTIYSNDVFNAFVYGKYPFQFLPILYMHTCIDKQLIHKIIHATGKFEFGYSQDIYTGLVNLLLLDSFVYTSMPLIIGGSSSIGIGKLVRNSEMNPKVYRIGMRNNHISSYNYFTNKSEELYWGALYTENERWFVFTEYTKIIDLGIFEDRSLPAYPLSEIMQSFKSMFELYDFRSKEANYLLYWVQHCAEILGKEVEQAFLTNKTSLINNRRRMIKNFKTKQLIKHIDVFGIMRAINSFLKKHKSHNSSPSKIEDPIMIGNDKYSIYLVGKRKELRNVLEASKLLETPKYKGLL